jgi:enamine deaminase RidA (YjgF/YER057c/UK114 family)
VRDPGVPLDDLIQEVHRLAVQAHDGTVGQCSGNLKKIIELTRPLDDTKRINATAALRDEANASIRNRRTPAPATIEPDDEPAF